ncbi:MAG: FAD-dependent oxidoreductase [Oscillospiraceae bacterium]
MIEIKEVLECDVLVAGGGIAGLEAAIAAAEEGADVICADKANSLRSGNGATGNDHFQCYVPEVHGTPEQWIDTLYEVAQEAKGLHDRDWIEVYATESWERCKKWEEWGIPMRPRGRYEFAGHHAPGQQGVHLKYAGQTQKLCLTKQALKCGVRILNRHPFMELITDESGEICGAICIDVSEEMPRIQIIRCKSVVLATGKPTRTTTRGWDMFNLAGCPADTGDGMVAAYNVGAKLLNLEKLSNGVGHRFLTRGGKSTWVGLYTDIEGKPFADYDGGFPGWEYGDYLADHDREIFHRNIAQGNPMFMNFSWNSDEDTEYMKWGLEHEGNSGTLDHLADEGFDFRKHMIQFGPNSIGEVYGSGLDCNTRSETSVKGLYAGGQEIGNGIGGISFAAVSGHIAGLNAAKYSRGREQKPAEAYAVAAEKIEHYNDILAREVSTATPCWQEIEIAVGKTMFDYCTGSVRSEKLFAVGLSHLDRIIEKAYNTLHCSNSHEFLKCLEVEKLSTMAKLIMLSARERRETRGVFTRADYPETDPAYDNKFISIQKINGAPVTGTRAMVM